jgi:hypothetical protein
VIESACSYYIEPFQNLQDDDHKITNQDQLDEQEQMLISFFGLDNLLNTQTGGSIPAYSPGDVKFNEYLNLPTRQNFFNVFRQLSTAANPQLFVNVNNWIEILAKEYASYKDRVNKSSGDTNAFWNMKENLRLSQNGLPRSYMTTILNQALPKFTMNGHVLLIAISTSAPKSAQNITESYFDLELLVLVESSVIIYLDLKVGKME